MHTLRPVVFLAASAVAAQTNPFVVFPQDPERQTVTASSYVRRPDWNMAAEAFQEMGNLMFRGVGDAAGGTCTARAFYHWAADENTATSETYGIILRTGTTTPGNGPDPTLAGEIVRVTGLTTPTGGGGRGTFIITDAFATPVTLPCETEWFQGIEFPANLSWPATDGHSAWAADPPGFSPATVGDNPRAGAPRVTWRIGTGGAVVTTAWTYIMGVRVDSPVFHIGGVDPLSSRQGAGGGPNLGMGGLFPDVSGTPRSDGLTLRVQDNVQPNGLGVFFLSTSFASLPFTFPGFGGRIYVDLSSMLWSGGPVSMTNGAAELVLAPPNVIPTSLQRRSLVMQALVVDPTTLTGSFTNAQRVAF
jgi:hypothetical protein